mmetsp:Transcript_23850/g.23524  ORF Transcript_23850/g.23524 Transcript_23850/m.23524 type:complete len:207 (-) Transcript_23850:34-654(-)
MQLIVGILLGLFTLLVVDDFIQLLLDLLYPVPIVVQMRLLQSGGRVWIGRRLLFGLLALFLLLPVLLLLLQILILVAELDLDFEAGSGQRLVHSFGSFLEHSSSDTRAQSEACCIIGGSESHDLARLVDSLLLAFPILVLYRGLDPLLPLRLIDVGVNGLAFQQGCLELDCSVLDDFIFETASLSIFQEEVEPIGQGQIEGNHHDQ